MAAEQSESVRIIGAIPRHQARRGIGGGVRTQARRRRIMKSPIMKQSPMNGSGGEK